MNGKWVRTGTFTEGIDNAHLTPRGLFVRSDPLTPALSPRRGGTMVGFFAAVRVVSGRHWLFVRCGPLTPALSPGRGGNVAASFAAAGSLSLGRGLGWG